jgi:hypothetical protein
MPGIFLGEKSRATFSVTSFPVMGKIHAWWSVNSALSVRTHQDLDIVQMPGLLLLLFGFRAARRDSCCPDKILFRKGEESMLTPQDKFKALIGQLGETLLELHTLCALNNAPAQVTNLFSLAVEETVDMISLWDESSVTKMIDARLAAHPVKFLED